jgi:hypothetical protein
MRWRGLARDPMLASDDGNADADTGDEAFAEQP